MAKAESSGTDAKGTWRMPMSSDSHLRQDVRITSSLDCVRSILKTELACDEANSAGFSPPTMGPTSSARESAQAGKMRRETVFVGLMGN